MGARAGAVVERGRQMCVRRLALAIVGAVLLACAAIVPAVADAGTLVIDTSPPTLSAIDLTQPHAVGVTITCPTTIGTLNVTLTLPDTATIPLEVNHVVNNPSIFFDFSISPAQAGDYVLNATSTGCGDAAPFTVTVTGPDVVTNVVTAPTQLSAADFSTTGVTFTGTGFHVSTTLQVASTVPGFVPTTVATDDSGAFTYTQTGSAATPDGYYSTTFTGALDGTSYGTFLVGTAPPTTSNPVLTLSTDSTGGQITLSQFNSTGVVASATGYAPGDLVLAFDNVDASGNSYLRGNGPPDGAGNFSATLLGTGDLASDRLGTHTVLFQSFLGPDVTGTFEVVPDPVVTVTADPDPVEQGATVTIGADNLDPNLQYLVLIDGGAGGLTFATPDGDGNISAPIALAASIALGSHTATVSPLGVPTTGPAPSVSFEVVAAGSTTTTTTTSTTTTSTSTTTTTTTSTTTTEPPTTSSTTTTTGASTSSTSSTTSTTSPTGSTTTGPPLVGPDVVLHPSGTGGPGPTNAAGAALAFTGSHPEKPALISASLIVAGCGCIFLASRRRRGQRSG